MPTNITCEPTDLWTGSGGHELPLPISTEIWSQAQTASAVLRASRHMRIPGSGVSIPIITSDAQASWVGETCAKPVSAASYDFKNIRAYKMAVIEIFSEEFIRDRRALYNELVRRLPHSFSNLIDATVFGVVPRPGEDFDTLASAPIVNLDSAPSTYGGLTNVLTAVAKAKGRISAWLAAPALAARLQTATDALGRPFFVNNPAGERSVGSVFGAPVLETDEGSFPEGIIGAAGDFAHGAVVGIVDRVRIKRSDQASVVLRNGTVVNLWQQNMVAVLVEFEVGFAVRNPEQFVRIAGTADGGQSQSGLGASGLVNVASDVVDVTAQVVTVAPGTASQSAALTADVAESILANSPGAIDPDTAPASTAPVDDAAVADDADDAASPFGANGVKAAGIAKPAAKK